MERIEILSAVQSAGQAVAEKAAEMPPEAWSYASDPRILLGACFVATLGAIGLVTAMRTSELADQNLPKRKK